MIWLTTKRYSRAFNATDSTLLLNEAGICDETQSVDNIRIFYLQVTLWRTICSTTITFVGQCLHLGKSQKQSSVYSQIYFYCLSFDCSVEFAWCNYKNRLLLFEALPSSIKRTGFPNRIVKCDRCTDRWRKWDQMKMCTVNLSNSCLSTTAEIVYLIIITTIINKLISS